MAIIRHQILVKMVVGNVVSGVVYADTTQPEVAADAFAFANTIGLRLTEGLYIPKPAPGTPIDKLPYYVDNVMQQLDPNSSVSPLPPPGPDDPIQEVAFEFVKKGAASSDPTARLKAATFPTHKHTARILMFGLTDLVNMIDVLCKVAADNKRWTEHKLQPG